MEKTSKELLKEFVNSQHFTNTAGIINSIPLLIAEEYENVGNTAVPEVCAYACIESMIFKLCKCRKTSQPLCDFLAIKRLCCHNVS